MRKKWTRDELDNLVLTLKKARLCLSGCSSAMINTWGENASKALSTLVQLPKVHLLMNSFNLLRQTSPAGELKV